METINFIHPKQLSPFPERLELPFPSGEILSGYEDVVSSGQDSYTTWVKTDPGFSHEFFDTNVPKRSYVQKRLSIYNWNPGPRRGKEGAIEKQIARKWHVITLQEAIDYVDHELFTNRFHVTHYGVVQCYSTKTPSSLKSKSNPFTFTIPGANCLIS